MVGPDAESESDDPPQADRARARPLTMASERVRLSTMESFAKGGTAPGGHLAADCLRQASPTLVTASGSRPAEQRAGPLCPRRTAEPVQPTRESVDRLAEHAEQPVEQSLVPLHLDRVGRPAVPQPQVERGRARAQREMRAKEMCRSCPVIAQCRTHALAVGEPPAAPDLMLKVRVAADLPAGERPKIEVMNEKGPAFESRLAALKTIVGADAARAANVLYQEGAAGLQDYIDKVSESGVAAQVAAAKLNNAKGDLEKLKGDFEDVLIGAGEGANGPIRGMNFSSYQVRPFARSPKRRVR